MSFKIETLTIFNKQAKRLSKKYPSLKNDLAMLFKSLEDDPTQGKALGNSFYKLRLAIGSKNKGKSGGARIITYVKITATTVYLTSIYDKSEKNNFTDKELEIVFKLIP